MLSILETNGFRYMPKYLKNCFTNYPVENAEAFLKWKKENGYTFFDRITQRFTDDDGSVVYNGNLCQYSAVFCFVIYDPELIMEWDKALIEDGINIDS